MNFIFDFDGTICDSLDITIDILNAYAKKLNRPQITKENFRTKGIEVLINEYHFNKLQVLLYVLKGRQELSKHINEMKSYEDLPEVLKKLSEKNNLGIVSSNSPKNIERFLKNNNLASYFKFIYSSTSLFDKSKKIKSAMQKYDLKASETVYIGDEIRDIKAAHDINLNCISVSWGFESKKLLREYAPNFLISYPKELLSTEKQLLH